MNFEDIVAQVAKVAEAVASTFVPGAEESIAAVKSVVGLIDSVQATFGTTADALSVNREELEAKIIDKAEREADALS